MDQKKVLELVEDLIRQYYEKRDMELLSRYLDDRTVWIGTGECEACHNISEAMKALGEDLSECGVGFTVKKTDLSYIPLSDTGGIVYGTLCAVPIDSELSEENLRLSVVLEETERGIKLVHMHFSRADIQQERGRYFVRQATRTDNESLRQVLSAQERKLLNLTKNIPGGAHQCAMDENFTLLSVSDGFLSMFGYSREELDLLYEGKLINMVYPGDRAEMIKTVHEQLQYGTDTEVEYRVQCKNGQPIWVLDKGRLMDDGREDSCFYSLLIDITDRKRQQEELRLSLERHKVIMNQATDIIFEWDILDNTLEFSSNWEKKFGYPAIDTNISSRIPLSKNIHPQDMKAFIKIMKDTEAGVPYSEAEFRICDLQRQYCWCRIRATTQYDSDGRPVKAVGVIVDIDDEKKQKQKLLKQVQYDTLTGIYNKAAVDGLVKQRMNGQCQMGCQALLIIDVDHFKEVNDTYGHLCGDSVLSEVAKALKSCTRSSDLAGRIGGDEFLIYLPEVLDERSVEAKAEVILNTIGKIRPKQDALPISCSIGAAVLPHGRADYETLYQYADSALYQRKKNGRNGYCFWGEDT